MPNTQRQIRNKRNAFQPVERHQKGCQLLTEQTILDSCLETKVLRLKPHGSKAQSKQGGTSEGSKVVGRKRQNPGLPVGFFVSRRTGQASRRGLALFCDTRHC